MNRLQAGIVGLGWGRVHIGTLRAAGVEVRLLAGRNRARLQEIARQEQVPEITTDLDRLAEFPVVVVATPASTHTELLRRFARQWVICEKPVFGSPVDPAWLEELDRPSVFVNYAFPFLASACRAARRIGALGRLQRVSVECGYCLPAEFTPEQWFLETTSHPLSWVLHVCGPAEQARCLSVGPPGIELEAMLPGGCVLRVRSRAAGEAGLHYRLAFEGSAGSLALEGCYRPGSPWQFGPLLVDGRPSGRPEAEQPDPWILANRRSVSRMVAVIRGDCAPDQARASGLQGVAAAARIEGLLFSALGSGH